MKNHPHRFAMAVAALMLSAIGGPAHSQGVREIEPERCPRFVASLPQVILASHLVPAQAEERQVRMTYLGHSTFLMESPAGVTIATDYSDVYRPASVPTIVTMNRAHSSHFTFYPDPEVAHVLEGWGHDGVPAKHELTVRDVWIRNVTTNIRGGFGLSASIQRDMNSMFVFEIAELCIAHLGHLHHPLTTDHLQALGRIDVLLAPVDGTYTLSVDHMLEVLLDIQAPLVIPMHYFGQSTLAHFIGRLEEHYAVEISDMPTVTLSRETLPARRTVLVLPPSDASDLYSID